MKINFDIRRLSHLAATACLAFTGTLHAGVPLPNVDPHQSVGTVNCASSTCHGSVTSWKDSNVLQNEYTTWLRLDKHAKAYSVLLNDRSRRIAKNLGLKEPAHQAKVCLDCHSHNPAPAQRGERHIVSDGVGCEGCHGPAGKWIGSHANPETSHAQNVANGLYPTNRPVEQARLCLSCHFGDESRFVTHRIMGAGHPRLSFELETFAAIAPPHYQIDADWHKRKGQDNGSADGTKVWAIGQAIAAKSLLDAFADPKRGRDGLFPELVLFDCQSCHHAMSEGKWTPRLGIGPGRIRLNDSNLLMLQAIFRATDGAYANSFDGRVRLLHQAVSGDPRAKDEDPVDLAKKLSAYIDTYIPRLESHRFDLATLRGILRALVETAQDGQYADYAGAEQAYMAISNVAASLSRQGGFKSVKEVNRKLASMRALLSNEEHFNPESFGKELSSMRNLLAIQWSDR